MTSHNSEVQRRPEVSIDLLGLVVSRLGGTERPLGRARYEKVIHEEGLASEVRARESLISPPLDGGATDLLSQHLYEEKRGLGTYSCGGKFSRLQHLAIMEYTSRGDRVSVECIFSAYFHNEGDCVPLANPVPTFKPPHLESQH